MPTYSHSQLGTYETCPRQYRFAYIDKLETDTEGIESFMGSRVHDVLQKLYRDLKVTRRNSLEELIEFYHQAWEKNWNGSIQVSRKEYHPDDYRRLGQKCIADYYARYSPFDQGRTLGLEEYISFPLDEEKVYWIRGYIDRLSLLNDDMLEIHDYKTSGRLPREEDVASDRQLAFYQMGVEGRWPGIRNVKLIWHYLSFDKEVRSSRSPDELSQVRQEALELIGQIEADRHFFPKEGPLCTWCEYQRYCPRRRHLVALESLPPNEYLKEEGVVLVNRYAELLERKTLLVNELDGEISKVEEALYAYGRRENLEAISGGGHLVKIKIENKEKYPMKGDPRRRALDDLIRKSGKWMDVSDLNPWMLARVLTRRGWSPELVQKVRQFCTVDESRSITLMPLKQKD
jgi:putative RecB family exonuclease